LGGTDVQTYGKKESYVSVNTPLQVAKWVSEGWQVMLIWFAFVEGLLCLGK